jgi:hypothetical protein
MDTWHEQGCENVEENESSSFDNVKVEIVDLFAFFDSVYGIFNSFVLVFSFNYQLTLHKPPNTEFSLNQSYRLHCYGMLVLVWVGVSSYFKVTT